MYRRAQQDQIPRGGQPRYMAPQGALSQGAAGGIPEGGAMRAAPPEGRPRYEQHDTGTTYIYILLCVYINVRMSVCVHMCVCMGLYIYINIIPKGGAAALHGAAGGPVTGGRGGNTGGEGAALRAA